MQSYQFTLAQTADEFEIEHGQDTTLLSSRQVGLDLLRRQDFHFVLRNFRRYAVVRWISDDQAFFHCPVERVVQHLSLIHIFAKPRRDVQFNSAPVILCR